MSAVTILQSMPLRDEVYLAAAERFSQLAHRDQVTDTNPIKYLSSSSSISDELDSSEARSSIDLAFSCLRYQSHLEELITEAGFLTGSSLPDDLNSLMLVLLWDFQRRKFVPRGSRSKTSIGDRHMDVQEVENQLESFAVKFDASLARIRIRESALNIGETLPEHLKQQENIRLNAPVYGWINENLSSISRVQTEISEGCRLECQKGTGLEEGLLKFSTEHLELLETSEMVKSGRLVLVDSTTQLGPLAVKNLLNGEETFDVLHAGGSLTALPILAHFVKQAIIKADTQKAQRKFLYGDENEIREPKLLICLSRSKHDEISERLVKYGVNLDSLILLPPLTTLSSNDPRLAHVKVCLVEPQCSLSAAANPLQFLLLEGRICDADKRLCALASGIPQPMEGLKQLLESSLRLPNSTATIYITRSKLKHENEDVVSGGLNIIGKTDFKLTPVPLSIPTEIAEKTYGKFLRVSPSQNGSGFFMAAITRYKTNPKDLLKKAALKGLITPVASSVSMAKSSTSTLNHSKKIKSRTGFTTK